MSEVFLVEFVVAQKGETSESLEKRLFAQAQVRQPRLEQVFWVGEESHSKPGGTYRQTFPPRSGLAHFLLQQAARTILAGDAHLLVTGESGAGAGLLASPEAVGVYNLVPQASIAERLNLPGSADLANLLQRRKIDLSEAACLAPAGMDPIKTAEIMAVIPAGQSLNLENENLWVGLQALTDCLKKESQTRGVLASKWQSGSLLSVIDRV